MLDSAKSPSNTSVQSTAPELCYKTDDALEDTEVFRDKLKSSVGACWCSTGNGGGEDNISTMDDFLDIDEWCE